MKWLCLALFASLLAAAGARAAPSPYLEEVPFVVTPDNVTLAMLQVARVGPRDYVIDLGSGDGRIVILAAKRFGARALGVELADGLVERSRAAARSAGVEGRAFFRQQDLFETDLSPASVITMYLLPEVNLALRPKLLALRPGTRIVSHDWDMGDWPPDKTVTVPVPEKEVGLEKSSKVHLWIVPARVEGTWCGLGKLKGASLRLTQQFQRFQGEISRQGQALRFDGRIEGAALRSPRRVNFRLEGDRLRAQALDRAYSPYQRGLFARARGADCG